MALKIDTFSNVSGGNAFYKAVGHPLAARRVPALLDRLAAGPVAIYDPLGFAAGIAEFYDLSQIELTGVYVQDVEEIGKACLGQACQPVTELPASGASQVFVAAFDADRLIAQMRHLVPAGAAIHSLDGLRLPESMLTDRRRYLNGLNFATNFVFFRDQEGHHTRLTTVDYWSTYGAKEPEIWCCLFDQDGAVLAEWQEALPGDSRVVTIDSREIRERFGLADFAGQLFIHVLKAAGHDVVKYALDTYGDRDDVLSCTHDANSWPADHYAGLPAPGPGEEVILWVQNSHPSPIPAGDLGLNLMGRDEVAVVPQPVPAFGTLCLETRALFPEAHWPLQFEVQAGRHFVRPRYEVVSETGRRRIAHANVERADLKPDPRLAELSNLMGKGFILPAPVLPPSRFKSTALPTPMATCQDSLPIKVLLYDAQGIELAARSLGPLPRSDIAPIEIDELLRESEANMNGAWGHMELVYDFSDGGSADGWLHSLFRYQDRHSGHAAETSFGAHMFNSVLTYKNEPQSYAGPAPGLSTRLFLRLGGEGHDTLCHLIYPASTPWHAESATRLSLRDRGGKEVASRNLAIPCGGSRLWRAGEMFAADELSAAADGYVVVRDLTCRLFGYHGLVRGESAFSFDHMFGF